jgi:uncharacterized protein YodC (DUF2158 family)
MSQHPSFYTGDTVRLKTGGPLMTIKSWAKGLYLCTWFGPGARLEEGTFDSRMLELIEPTDARSSRG